MALKRDLWYYGLALATSSLVRVTPTLAIAIPIVNITYIPNFSLLKLPHGLKQGPVALGPGPGPLLHGEVLVQAHLDHGDHVRGPLGHGDNVQVPLGHGIQV